jgi:hypothetical protein
MMRDTHPSGAVPPRCDATSNVIRESVPRSTARCHDGGDPHTPAPGRHDGGDPGDPPAAQGSDPDPEGASDCAPARFEFPLDWKAVLHRIREEARRGCVPHEVQQALR